MELKCLKLVLCCNIFNIVQGGIDKDSCFFDGIWQMGGGSIAKYFSLSADGLTLATGTIEDSNYKGKVQVFNVSDLIAPSIIGPSGSTGDGTSSKSIYENSTAVHTFSANESVTWSLNGGADAGKFNINSSSGALSFANAPDYENPTDSDSNNSYVVGVRATDGAGNTSDQTVTVSINDLDDTPPSITGPSGSAGAGSSAKSINENLTAVHTFTANESVTWSLNGGADAGTDQQEGHP